MLASNEVCSDMSGRFSKPVVNRGRADERRGRSLVVGVAVAVGCSVTRVDGVAVTAGVGCRVTRVDGVVVTAGVGCSVTHFSLPTNFFSSTEMSWKQIG